MNEVSKISSTFFLFIMLFSILKNPVLFSIYEYDKDLFISVFCENKNRPQLNCDGKCYLAKIQQEQKEEEAANRLKQLQTEITYNTPEKTLMITDDLVIYTEGLTQSDYYNKFYTFDFTLDMVKPPESTTS